MFLFLLYTRNIFRNANKVRNFLMHFIYGGNKTNNVYNKNWRKSKHLVEFYNEIFL